MATSPKQTSQKPDQFSRHDRDVGSPEVQVSRLTARIATLTDHLKQAPKDRLSRRGLLQMVGKRRRQLDYLIKHRPQTYQKLLKELNIRK